MIRLRTLGSVDLRASDGVQIQSVLRQPKRLALLIYLALTGTGSGTGAGVGTVFHRRDKLLAMFWPESDEEHARGSLNQAIFQLRAALGRDTIVNRGDDEIGLAPGRIWCDATAFRDFLKAKRAGDAMALHGGELLSGFIIDEAPDFERWLDEERVALALEAANACIELSEQAVEARDMRLAVQWVRRAIALQPFDEPAYQRLIALLDQSGDRAAALRAYEELRELLQSEFEAEPSAETVELIKAVRARAESKNGKPVLEVRAESAHVESERRRESSRMILAVTSGILIIGALFWGAVAVRKPKPYHPPADHVAVLYFNDESANHELGYLAEGLTSTLIEQLGQVKKLKVISQNGVRPFRGHSIPLDSIARQLDVGTIVGGSITQSNGKVRVTVELVDGATGIAMHSKKLERPNGELFVLLDDVSREVASFLRFALGSEIRLRERQSETNSVEAWRHYQRAEVLRSALGPADKINDVAEARADLERADSLLAHAAKLDKDWVAPVVLRGRIAQRRAWTSLFGDRPPQHAKWLDVAEDYANRALRIDDQSAAALELRGGIKLVAALLQAGRNAAADSLRAAERDLKAALAIMPDLPRAESDLSAVLFVQGRFEEARRAAKRALDADAYLTDADEIVNRLFISSFEAGDDAEAGYWCDEVRRRMAKNWPSAYCDLVLLGWSSGGSPDPRKALQLLETFGAGDSEPLRASMRPRIMILTAAVLARAGQADSARAMLGRARGAAPQDIELMYLEAGVRVLLADRAEAVRLLQDYWRVNPMGKARIANGRMFRPLQRELGFAATETRAATDRQSPR